MSRSSEHACGVLLHPTSLPGGHGIGDIGSSARAFVDLLERSGVTYWQVLPLNPPDFLGSPYSALSAMAANPMLADLAALADRGWIPAAELPVDVPGNVDFEVVGPAKERALRRAHELCDDFTAIHESDFVEFCHDEQWWLDDWALFAAIRTALGGGWMNWPEPIVRRDPDAIARASDELAGEIDYQKFAQWVTFEQWRSLRHYAAERGVKLIGDIPIFVAMDSSDVWANRDVFEVTDAGEATVVAGVPPDYFSETGQKWGNPLYRWDRLAETDYDFWRARIRVASELCDIVRIDHFRGFESYWEVPADAPTAETGEWMPGPGMAFFDWVKDEFGALPFIAEDLGLITDAVRDLLEATGLPGMKVMQFAFDGSPDHPFLPHTYPRNCVGYTGTHDNDTTQGWYDSLSERERHNVRSYLSHPDEGIVWAMIERLLGSDAWLTIVPFQDLHELGTDARMNLPGTSTADNWSWRMTADQLADVTPWDRLRDLVELYGRRV